MTPNDLKTGMIVTLRNGTEGVVFRDCCSKLNDFAGRPTRLFDYSNCIVDVKGDAWFMLKSYNPNFECNPGGISSTHIREYDIIKIEKARHPFDFLDLERNRDQREVIWEKCKRLTVSEIENLLGYKVEIVSEEE